MTDAPRDRAAGPAVARASLLVRLQYPIVAAILLAFLLVGWHGREPPMRAAGDDEFVYLALSKSLESGSYREIYRPTAPLHVQYPPGYPVWLVLVRNLVGEDLHLIRAGNLVLAGLALLVLYLVARRLAGIGLALTLLFLLALNRGVLTASSLTSEGLFLLLSAATLAWTLPNDQPKPRSAAVGIALALFAFLTRSIGLALVIAVGAWLWTSHRRRALAAWAVASVLVVGGWLAYSASGSADPTVHSYAKDFTAGMPTSGGLLQHLAGRIWHNGVAYATTNMPHALALPTLPHTVVDNWAWLLLTAVLMTVGFGLFWRRWPAAAAYVLCYIGMVLAWTWESGRLLIPLLPLGMLAFLLGARWMTAFLPDTARRVVLGSLVALLGIGAVQGGLERYSLYRHCDRAHPYTSPGCYDRPRLALAAGAEFVRLHGRSDDVVFTDQPASVNFLSRHLTEPTPPLWGTQDRAVDLMRARNVRFILFTRAWQAQTLLSSCAELEIQAIFPPEAGLLSRADTALHPDACPALREIARRYSPP